MRVVFIILLLFGEFFSLQASGISMVYKKSIDYIFLRNPRVRSVCMERRIHYQIIPYKLDTVIEKVKNNEIKDYPDFSKYLIKVEQPSYLVLPRLFSFSFSDNVTVVKDFDEYMGDPIYLMDEVNVQNIPGQYVAKVSFFLPYEKDGEIVIIMSVVDYFQREVILPTHKESLSDVVEDSYLLGTYYPDIYFLIFKKVNNYEAKLVFAKVIVSEHSIM